MVFLVCGKVPGPESVLALAGLRLRLVNAFAIGLFVGMVCAWFRDIQRIVTNAMQFLFFLSPGLWKPQLLGDQQVWLPLNPVHILTKPVPGPLVNGTIGSLIDPHCRHGSGIDRPREHHAVRWPMMPGVSWAWRGPGRTGVTYSAGMVVRLSSAAARLTNPPIVPMDE